jgi:hypothetical protein
VPKVDFENLYNIIKELGHNISIVNDEELELSEHCSNYRNILPDISFSFDGEYYYTFPSNYYLLPS